MLRYWLGDWDDALAELGPDVADVRGLSAELREFDDELFVTGALADAVTYADQTTGPNGVAVDVETRMADMLRRHGPDSSNARVDRLREPVVRAVVRRTEQRLRGRPPYGGSAMAAHRTHPVSAPDRGVQCLRHAEARPAGSCFAGQHRRGRDGRG